MEPADLYRDADHLKEHGGAKGRPLKAKTINQGHLAAIRAVHTWAVKRGK